MTKPDRPAPAPPRRGRPKSDDLRRRILDAAIDLFARQGVERTTTREVAAQACTTERTLFQHFGSKDGLLEAVVEQALLAHVVPNSLAGLGRDLEAFGGDLEAWHRGLLRSRLAAWQQAGQLTRLLVVEALRRPALLDRFVQHWRPAAWEPLLALFSSLRESGLLRPDVDAAALARHFLAVNVSFLMMRVVVAPAVYRDDEAEIAALAKVFAAGAGRVSASGGLP